MRFLASELPETPAQDCLFQIIPVPYEASVSYGSGTALGPEAIVEASSQLEVWTGECIPAQKGIYTWPPVGPKDSPQTTLDAIEAATAKALAVRGQSPVVPILLGGEHTVTLGALRALKKRYGHFGVIQFDAHADLRDSYHGTPFSHACVMRRAVDDLGLDLFQFGVRSLSPEEVSYRKEKKIGHWDARQLALLPQAHRAYCLSHNYAAVAEEMQSPLLPGDFPRQVFLTFDVDAFDCSLMPATGTPEPGGLSWWDALHLVRLALHSRTVLGFDVTELSPQAGVDAPSFTAARLVYELMAECLLSRRQE